MNGFTFIMPILLLRTQKVPTSHLPVDSLFCLGPPTKLSLGFEGKNLKIDLPSDLRVTTREPKEDA